MFALQFEQLNRHGELRHDIQAVKELSQSKDARFMLVCEQHYACVDDQPLWLTQSAVDTDNPIPLIYLGSITQSDAIDITGNTKNKPETPYFAVRVATQEGSFYSQSNLTWSDLRSGLKTLSEQDSYLINVATAMENWHRTHQFCGDCGHETFATQGGFERHCSNSDCENIQFPRTDAAVICAITYEDKILLGRQATWPEHRYSVIAGFVEPGESLEQAVKREAMEETGVVLSEVNYFSSQPWPFPQSLMVGFTAVSSTETIDLQDKELEHAAWFSRESVEQRVNEGTLILPNSYSISRALVEQWRQQNN